MDGGSIASFPFLPWLLSLCLGLLFLDAQDNSKWTTSPYGIHLSRCLRPPINHVSAISSSPRLDQTSSRQRSRPDSAMPTTKLSPKNIPTGASTCESWDGPGIPGVAPMKPRFCGESFASDINGLCIFGRSWKSPDWLRPAAAVNRLTDGLENSTGHLCRDLGWTSTRLVCHGFFFLALQTAGRCSLQSSAPSRYRSFRWR